jgi:hypothetical protein
MKTERFIGEPIKPFFHHSPVTTKQSEGKRKMKTKFKLTEEKAKKLISAINCEISEYSGVVSMAPYEELKEELENWIKSRGGKLD